MDALDKFCLWLLKRPKGVLGVALVVTACCAPFALQLVDVCRFAFEPVPGTPTFEAQGALRHTFPELLDQDVEVILVSCECDVANHSFALAAVEELRSLCERLDRSHEGVLRNWTDHFQFAASAAGRLHMPSPFLSPSQETLIFQLAWTVGKRQREVIAMLEEVRQAAQGLDQRGAKEATPVQVALTGQLALFSDTLTSTRADIEKKDIIVMPFALLVLATRVGSLRLMLVPICCLACSLSTSLGLFLPFALYVVDISPLAPSTMVFLGMALAIDYSLFMLTRYMEEVLPPSNKDTEPALRAMMRQSGHVVLISASVLAVCYAGVLFYPSGGIATIGLGAALTVFLCAASNLMLTPALITALPNVLGAEQIRRRPQRRCRRCNCWPSLAKVVTRQPAVTVIPVLCLALLLPACCVLFHYHESFANTLTFPGKSDTSLTYNRLVSEFPAGKMSPQYVLIPAENGTVESDAYFERTCDVAQALLLELGDPPYNLRPKDLLGPALLPKALSTHAGLRSADTGLACLRWQGTEMDPRHPFGSITAQTLLQLPNDLGEAYREQWHRLVSGGSNASMLLVTVPFNPYSDTLWPFVQAARKAIDGAVSAGRGRGRARQEEAAADTRPMLFGSLTIVFDIVQVTYQRLPYIVVGTVAAVFALVALAFRAALAPVKMFVTVFVPLAAVFGVAVLVYQDGALNWLPGGPGNNPFTSPPGGGFYWAAPVFTCTIIVGLALDYDVFLFARVVELRKRGFSNAQAVRGGLALTGPTITAAGLIMAIAFSGLLLSDVPANNQIGFVMAFGVLMDTFVIRTCLVPSVLIWGQSLNYWPQKMPAVCESDGVEMLLLDE
ncbi:unnamed protein product [Effrenium voratum]|nr:unnamed protein product [Effrenium voratum]